MFSDEIVIKYVGGATALLEVAGIRFLTDPAFDAKDTLYDTGIYVLHKTTNPAITMDKIGHIDYVLLSHDHHFDNLDHAGKKFLTQAIKVFTTPIGAERLGANAIGLQHWQTEEIFTPDERIITITGTPCRHGPVGGDRGPVTGFVLNFKGNSEGGVYITGDTVWYEGVEEVARRFNIKIVVAFLGAAVVKQVGSAYLTMTVDESLQLAKVFSDAKLVPLHFEGWEHFTESSTEILTKYKKAGMLDRLQWAEKA